MAAAAKIFGIVLLLSMVLGEAMVLCQALQPAASGPPAGAPKAQAIRGFPLRISGGNGSVLLPLPSHRTVS